MEPLGPHQSVLEARPSTNAVKTLSWWVYQRGHVCRQEIGLKMRQNALVRLVMGVPKKVPLFDLM